VTRLLGWLAALDARGRHGHGLRRGAAREHAGQRAAHHVPARADRWVAYLAFGVVLAASVAYLARRRAGADRARPRLGEVGVCSPASTSRTGAIWGKPTWGTWWTWDARLTSVAIVFVMYLGYCCCAA
jgi:ABC-type transport system involved in cytochrome c biogenesis permease subunit